MIVDMKRLCLFCFYDEHGIVDDYVIVYLKALKKNVERIIIVCNGVLTVEGKKRFEEIVPTSDVIIRENVGFDAWAHKTAIDNLGWKAIASYDELILTNTTIMGPLYPLEDMFSTMDKNHVDFWGITRHYFTEDNPFNCVYGCVPEHIQSWFIVFRKSVTTSSVFQRFWKKLPPLDDYAEAVGKYELVLTKMLNDAGFDWDTYVDTSEYKKLTITPISDYPMELIEKNKCPFLKRKNFINEYLVSINGTAGQQAIRLMNYISETKIYDIDLIWQNILRTGNMSDIVKNLGLLYVLPTKLSYEKKVYNKQIKIAYGLHLYFSDLFKEYISTILRMPKGIDVYITTDTEEKRQEIISLCEDLQAWNISVLKVDNRGRDVSALWVVLREYLKRYDYVCFVHDKKAGQVTPGSIGESWARKLLANTVASSDFVSNVIDTLETNERLGLLVPPAPIHGPYLYLKKLWTTNYENTVELAKRLGVDSVPIDYKKEPITAIGSCFWFKTAALKQMFMQDWVYEDFPVEPLPEDGTISHAIERIYAFMAQHNGYYTAFLMSDEYASIEYLTLDYYVKHDYMVDGNKSYVAYLERQVRKYYKQTSLKWQIKHRICRLLKIKEKDLEDDE